MTRSSRLYGAWSWVRAFRLDLLLYLSERVLVRSLLFESVYYQRWYQSYVRKRMILIHLSERSGYSGTAEFDHNRMPSHCSGPQYCDNELDDAAASLASLASTILPDDSRDPAPTANVSSQIPQPQQTSIFTSEPVDISLSNDTQLHRTARQHFHTNTAIHNHKIVPQVNRGTPGAQSEAFIGHNPETSTAILISRRWAYDPPGTGGENDSSIFISERTQRTQLPNRRNRSHPIIDVQSY